MFDRVKRKIERREGSRHEAWIELNGLVVCDRDPLIITMTCISPQSPLKADYVEAPHSEGMPSYTPKKL